MTPERLSERFTERFGEAVRAEETYGLLTVDVPAEAWVEALTFARDDLGCDYFDWLTGVDELAEGYSVVAHVYAISGGHHLLLRTRVPREAPRLPTASGVYRGANWHERETYEMFGVEFAGHPNLVPLLLPDGFEGHPLRKEFVLASRAAKPWPGAKEPGESDRDGGAPGRRRMLPPGVPDPHAWGPRRPGEPLPSPEAVAEATTGARESRARPRPRRGAPAGPATEAAPTNQQQPGQPRTDEPRADEPRADEPRAGQTKPPDDERPTEEGA